MCKNAARIACTTLYVFFAVAVLWGTPARAATSELFGLRATFESTYFVLEMRLPALCLRLQADIPAFIVASAHLLTCDRCFEVPRARSWS